MRNQLLGSLDPEDFELLKPHMQAVSFDIRKSVEQIDEPIEQVYFPTDGILSVVAEAHNRQTEVGIIGHEGMSGLALVLCSDRSPFKTFSQVAGDALCIDAALLQKALKTSVRMHSQFLRYARAFMVQMAYTAVATSTMKIEERLARWLLMLHDRLLTNKIALTHEFLSVMLSVRRPGVTVAIHILEGEGLIRATRGLLEIVDRKGLEKMAKGSYGPTETEHERLLGYSLGNAHKSFTKMKNSA